MMLGRKLSIKILISLWFFIFFLALIFIVYLCWDLPFDKLEKVKTQQETNVEKNIPEYLLEEGSGVLLSDLQDYYLFTEAKNPFHEWFQELVESEKVSQDNHRVYVKTNFHLPALVDNTCKDIFCFQQKLDFNNIPSIFWKGLIGIEDTRFLDHFGIDFKSILRALVKDIMEQKLAQGGSTLTQQLVKNLFFTNERSLIRKIKEIILAIYIENKLLKEEILEIYFNEVYWGSLQGIHVRGIYAASLFYFNKKIEEITPYEAAILISLLKGPGYYNPIYNLERLKQRTQFVYDRLIQQKLFSSEKSFFWTDSQWISWQKNLTDRNRSKPYYALTIDRSNDYTKLMGQYEFFVLKKNIQTMLSDIEKRYKGESFATKVIIGVPTQKQLGEYRFYSKVEKKKEAAFGLEKQQIGSILKPIVYSIFFKNNISAEDLVSTKPFDMPLKSGKWSPKEAHTDLPENVTVKEALFNSYNRPVITLAQLVGFKIVEKELKRYLPELMTPLEEYPAQLIGSLELSLNRVYELYTAFLHDECKKNLQNMDENNSSLFLLASPDKTTIKNVVTDNMSQLKFFGKTGTTNNGYNNWFVFYDGHYLGVIWVGFEGRQKGQEYRLFGSTTAFKIFQSFFSDRGKRFNELSCDIFK
jgi:penicillin-binding protein 1B